MNLWVTTWAIRELWPRALRGCHHLRPLIRAGYLVVGWDVLGSLGV